MYIKKIACMFLAFMIAVTFMPAYGFAAGDDPANPDDYVITDGNETAGSDETADSDNQGTEGTLHFEKESDTFDMSEHLEGGEDYYYDYAYYTINVINGSNMSYSISNSDVAYLENWNDESVKLYVRGIGETDITAYSGDGQSAVFKLSVTASVKQLSIYTDGSYGVGDSFDMRYEVTPSCLHDSTDIEWSSSDSSLASVDGNGRVTLKKYGDVTITAKCGDITASRAIDWSNNSFSSDEFEYSVAGKSEATITKYKGSNTEIVIPGLGSTNKKGIYVDASIEIGVIIAIVVVIGLFFLLRYSKLGRNFYAVGGNQQSALMLGINVKRTKFLSYVFCGLLAGIAGYVFFMHVGSGSPAHAQGAEMNAIAASIIGGTMLTGGVGNIIGTLFGVLSLCTIKDIVTSIGLDDAWWTGITVAGMLCIFLVIQSVVMAKKHAAGTGKEQPAEAKAT